MNNLLGEEVHGVKVAMKTLDCARIGVAAQAVQLFGSYGYTKEYPVGFIMYDAKITEIYEGTSEVQRLVIGSGLTH